MNCSHAFLGSINLILEHQYEAANKLLNHISPKEKSSFFFQLIKLFPEIQDRIEYLWPFACFYSRYANLPNPFSQEKDFHFLFSQKDPSITFCIPFIIKPSKFDISSMESEDIYRLILSLITFGKSNPTLAHSFILSSTTLINEIRPELFLDQCELSSLYIMTDFDASLLKNHLFSHSHFVLPKLEDLFEISSNFNVIKAFQDEIVLTHPYPKSPPESLLQISPILFSLINTSIESHQHFFDIVTKLVFQAFEECKLNLIPEYLKAFPFFISYFILMKIDKIYENFWSFSRLLSAKLPYAGNKTVQIYANKIINDFSLISKLSTILKRKVSIKEVQKTSLTVFLTENMNALNDFLSLRELSYYSLTDQQRDQDFDIIYSFLAISDFIKIIEIGRTGKFSANSSTIEVMFNELSQQILQIKNEQIRQNVLIDLYCLIFLTTNLVYSSLISDKNSHIPSKFRFLCSTYCADSLLNLIKKFIEPTSSLLPYIKSSLSAISSSMVINQDLESYTGKNRILLLKSLSKKDWKNAETFIHLNSQYKKDFTLAHSIAQFKNDSLNSCPEYSKLFNLELGLSKDVPSSILESSKSIDFSSETEKAKFESIELIVNKLVDKRISTKNKDILSPFINSELWEQISKSITTFVSDPEEFLRFRENFSIFKKTPHLHEFISFIHLLFQCQQSTEHEKSNKNPSQTKILTFDSNEEAPSLRTSVQNAITSAVISNDIQRAIKLSKIFNIDLFEYVMKHSDIISMNQGFIEVIFGTQLTDNEFSTYIPFFKSLPELIQGVEDINSGESEEPNEDVLLLAASTALDNPATPFEFFDDILFRIDHSKFANILLSKIGKIPEKTLTDLLSIISYAMSSSQLAKVKTLMNKTQISKIIGNKTGIAAIDAIIASKHFSLLAELCSESVNTPGTKSSSFDNFLEIFLDTVTLQDIVHRVAETSIDDLPNFIRALPDKYEFFAQELENYPSAIFEICPPKSLQIFTNFLKLPFIIRHRSWLYSSDSITNSIISNPSLIPSLDSSIITLLSTENIVSILKSLMNTPNQFLSSASTFLKFIESFIDQNKGHLSEEESDSEVDEDLSSKKKEIHLLTEEYFETLLQNFKVSSRDSESSVLDQFLELRWFKVLDDETRLNHLIEFFQTRPYVACETPYGLSNLLEICFLCDLDSIAVSLGVDFSLDLQDYVMTRASLPMQMSLFQEAKSILHDYEEKFGSVDVAQFRNQGDPVALPFLMPFMKEACYPVEFLNLINNFDIECLNSGGFSNFSIYQHILFHSRTNHKSQNKVIKRTQSQSLASMGSSGHLRVSSQKGLNILNKVDYFFFVKRFCSPISSLPLFVAFEDFGNVFSILITLGNNAPEVFIHKVYMPAIMYDVLKSLQKSFPTFDPKLERTMNLWENLQRFLFNRSMFRAAFSIADFLVRKKEAAEAALKIFKQEKESSFQLAWIGSAAGLYRELCNVSKVDEELRKIKKLTKLQLDICSLIYEHNLTIPPGETINVIDDVDKAPVNVGALISLQKTIDEKSAKILKRLKENFGLSQKQIYQKIAQQILEGNIVKDLPNIIQSIQQRKDGETFLSTLLPILATSPDHWKMIPTLIYLGIQTTKNGIIDHDAMRTQILLFLEYDCLAEVYGALETRYSEFPDLIPLACYRASQLGATAIENRLNALITL